MLFLFFRGEREREREREGERERERNYTYRINSIMYNQGLRNYIRCRNCILVRHVQIVPISALHGNDICMCYDNHKDIVFKGHISLFYLLQSQKILFDN